MSGRSIDRVGRKSSSKDSFKSGDFLTVSNGPAKGESPRNAA